MFTFDVDQLQQIFNLAIAALKSGNILAWAPVLFAVYRFWKAQNNLAPDASPTIPGRPFLNSLLGLLNTLANGKAAQLKPEEKVLLDAVVAHHVAASPEPKK